MDNFDEDEETYLNEPNEEEEYLEVGTPPQLPRNHTNIDVQGVHIKFPFPPYDCQKDLMNKLATGLTNAQHCLLESPTGTGKTAVLLCSVLAWQRKFQDDRNFRENVFAMTKDTIEKLKCVCEFEVKYNELKSNIPDAKVNNSTNRCDKSCSDLIDVKILDESLENKSHAPNVSNIVLTPEDPERDEAIDKFNALLRTTNIAHICRRCAFKYFIIPKREMSCEFPPKIFYTTRTHHQIKGVTNELRASCYSDSKMTILSARGETCLNSEVKVNPKVFKGYSTDSSNDDLKPEKIAKNMSKNCSLLKSNYYWNEKRAEKLGHSIDPPIGIRNTCTFYKPDSFSIYKNEFHRNAQGFDIEDLVKFGNISTCCSFFGARYLLQDSEIVFCPYNYIINPNIRSALKIDLRGAIVIFDEAHNLASICEQTFSQDIKLTDVYFKMLNPLKNFLGKVIVGSLDDPNIRNKSMVIKPENFEFVKKIEGLLDRTLKWIRTKGKSQKRKRDGDSSDEFEKFVHSFTNTEIIKDLNQIGFSQEDTTDLRAKLQSMKMSEEEDEFIEENNSIEIQENQTITEDIWIRSAKIKGPGNVVKKIFKFFKFFTATILRIHEDLKDKSDTDCADFKIFIETLNIKNGNQTASQNSLISQACPQTSQSTQNGKKEKLILKIVCLNPALAFKPIRDQTHSTIVISGTLSPFDTFESELETKFMQKLAGNHVITAKNLHIERIDRCLITKEFLNFTFLPRTQGNTLRGIGEWLIKICEIVPKGVLVFFSSYAYMEQVLNFLKFNFTFNDETMNFHAKLKSLKHLFVEARNKDEFKVQMKEYAEKINETQDGCLFFGVLRGKASEGTNFCDDMARAVLCIGIPYASKQDLVVEAKMNYIKNKNSKVQANKWYDAQAFRAINQAIGRCIRHSNDWGMIIVMDERFNSSSCMSNFPIWVKNKLQWRIRVQQKVEAINDFIASKTLHEAETQIILK